MARKKGAGATSGTTLALSERARGLLKTLVEHHIRDGQPVGSKALARDSGFELSPATVRNVMADLEGLGLIVSPHTSAGRVPTAKGYRLFVDRLLTVQPPTVTEVARIRGELAESATVDRLVATCSGLLSNITRMAGVVMVPRREVTVLRRIEFVPLSDQRVLAILVVNEREVENRIIRTERQFSDSELQEAANRLNALLTGRDLRTLRSQLLGELHQTRQTVSTLMQRTLEMADELFEHRAGEQDFVVAGQTNLMHFSELADVTMLRSLFEVFQEKRELLQILDECMTAQTVQVFIGEESGYRPLEQCSLVAAPYGEGNRILGVLGVIGPTRMAYERVIPLVDVTAKMLSSILNSRE